MSRTLVAVARLIAASLIAAATACQSSSPADDYEDFIARSGRNNRDATIDTPNDCVRSDLTGRWHVHALLAAGIDLGLTIRFDATEAVCQDVNNDGCVDHYRARIWLDSNPDTPEPLVDTCTCVRDDGRFDLKADPLELGTEVLPTALEPVIATVLMDSCVPHPQMWCGTADGRVQSPLDIDLDGSTFAAVKDPRGDVKRQDIPILCPIDPGAPLPDAAIAPDAGIDGGSARPEPPDLSEVPSQRANLTGHWLLQTTPIGNLIPLQLWLSLLQSDGEQNSAIDGAVRLGDAELGTPALATFSTLADGDGRFEIWLDSLSIDSGAIQVEADVLLAAATLDEDSFCGAGAGDVRRPIPISLDETRFYATRWAPGEPPPQTLADRCPE